MKEQLTEYKTAKLARENGFNIPCLSRIHSSHCHFYEAKGMKANIPFYDEFLPKIRDWNNYEQDDRHNNKGKLKLYLSIPTQSLLQRWLREEHYIHLWIELIYHDGDNYVVNFEFKILTFFNNIDESDKWDASFNKVFDTYEKALEKGLFEALKLIK